MSGGQCQNCGTTISPTARFCESCGVEQTAKGPIEAAVPPSEPAEPTRTGPPPATEFVQLLREYGQLPGVKLAAIGGLIGAAVVLAAGFVLAIALPDNSFAHIGASDETDLWRETLIHATTTTLATIKIQFEDGSVALRAAPLLFVAFPIGGCAFGARRMVETTASLPTSLRYAWGAATAIPFALLMLLISIFAGTIDEQASSLSPSEGSVFLLALLWGAVGGLLGTAWALRRQAPGLNTTSWSGRAAITGREALRPLGISLLVLGIVGLLLWGVQISRDAAEARSDRSVATALVDDVLYSADLGFRYQALGSGAELGLFSQDLLQAALGSASEEDEADDDTTAAAFLPIPLSKSKIAGGLIDERGFQALDAKYRIFDYGDVLPAWFFGPLLLILIVVPALLALYAGFAIARANGVTTSTHGAAWGAVVGPLWAAALALISTLTQDVAFGQVDGDSLFVLVLFIGAALGALGGLGATQGLGRSQEVVAPTSPPA